MLSVFFPPNVSLLTKNRLQDVPLLTIYVKITVLPLKPKTSCIFSKNHTLFHNAVTVYKLDPQPGRLLLCLLGKFLSALHS